MKTKRATDAMKKHFAEVLEQYWTETEDYCKGRHHAREYRFSLVMHMLAGHFNVDTDKLPGWNLDNN